MIAKKIKILATAALATVVLGTGFSYADESLNGIIIQDNVPMRYNADHNGAVTGMLKMNTITGIHDIYGEWVLVNNQGQTGWVYKDNIFVKDANSKMVGYGDVNASRLNVRKGPGLEFAIIGKLLRGDDVFIIGTNGDWYFIKNDLVEGWVFSPYIQLSNQTKKAKVVDSAEYAEVNRGGSRDTNTTNILSNQNVEILDFQDGLYYIKKEDDSLVWVDAEGVEIAVPTIQNTSSQNDEIVKTAKQYLGKPYVWGANGPNSFDCSGYTRFVYGKFGVQLPRVSRDQANAGQWVNRSDLKVGDLVFFDTTGAIDNRITHVGIYIGNNEFIHASSSRTGKYVRISSMAEGFYYSRYVTARRVK